MMIHFRVFLSGPRKGEPRTQQDRVIRWLQLSFGCKPAASDFVGAKTRKFTIPQSEDFFFVGKNGGLRRGKTKVRSISLTDRANEIMAQWERTVLKEGAK